MRPHRTTSTLVLLACFAGAGKVGEVTTGSFTHCKEGSNYKGKGRMTSRKWGGQKEMQTLTSKQKRLLWYDPLKYSSS